MSSTTTSEQTSSPPEWAQPLFERSAQDAMSLYDSQPEIMPYQGSTVAGLSDTTMSGVNQLAQAGQNWNTAGTRPLFGQIGASAVSSQYPGMLTDLSGNVSGGQTDMSGYGGATNAANNIGTMANNLFGSISSGETAIGTGSDFRDIYNRAQAPSSAAQNLQGYASGENLSGEGNPFYRQRLEGELSDAAAQVRSQMSGMGRGGSGAETRRLTDRLGQMRLEGLENDWNREQANQFRATGMIDAANQAGLNTQLGAISGQTGVEGQNIANQLSAGGQQVGAQTNMANLLRGIAGDTASFSAGDLDRRLSAQGLQGNLLGQAAGLEGQGLDRAQRAATSMAGLDQQNFQNQLTGAGATLEAGGILDTQAQRQLSDDVSRYYEAATAPWQGLGLLQAAAGGAAGPYGQQIGSSRTSNPAAVLGGLGGLMGGK